MTMMKKRAISIIQEIPDDKLFYILQLLEGVNGLTKENEQTKRKQAFQYWESMRSPAPLDFDYEAELASWREEKYGDHNSD